MPELVHRIGSLTVALLILLPLTVGGEPSVKDESGDAAGELSWEMPGRLSIFDLQFGPAVLKDKNWEFRGNSRTFSAGDYPDRLSLMIRFKYSATTSTVPLKFVIKLPQSRQYEETVTLRDRRGNHAYMFTIQRPEDFVGSGSVYLYYGFSIVHVLDFTILPKS